MEMAISYKIELESVNWIPKVMGKLFFKRQFILLCNLIATNPRKGFLR